MSNDDRITFLCPQKLDGVIPEPTPAHEMLPDWYEKLPLETNGTSERTELSSSTVKACIPFLEAMKAGWILKTPADISITVEDGEMNMSWRLDATLGDTFSMAQVGRAFPDDGPIMKFNNYWRAEVPDGYSMLMVPPMNRPSVMQQPFLSFSGIITVDNYTGYINNPALWTAGDWDGVIPQGTPLSQIIFFERDSLATTGEVRKMTPPEQDEYETGKRNRVANQRYYREEVWESIDGTRNIDPSTQPDASIESEDAGWEEQ